MSTLFQVGVGSGGMPVLDLLCRDPRISRVVLVEPDVYKPHNVGRHLFPASAVGRLKAELAREWIAEMDRRGVPCAPINDYAEALADPQVEELGLVRTMTLPNGVATRTTAFPIRFTGYEFAIHRPPPALGAHTAEIYGEWLPSRQPGQSRRRRSG